VRAAGLRFLNSRRAGSALAGLAPSAALTAEQVEALAPLVRLWTWRVHLGLTPVPKPMTTPPATPPPMTDDADTRTKLAIMFIERMKTGKVRGWSA